MCNAQLMSDSSLYNSASPIVFKENLFAGKCRSAHPLHLHIWIRSSIALTWALNSGCIASIRAHVFVIQSICQPTKQFPVLLLHFGSAQQPINLIHSASLDGSVVEKAICRKFVPPSHYKLNRKHCSLRHRVKNSNSRGFL